MGEYERRRRNRAWRAGRRRWILSLAYLAILCPPLVTGAAAASLPSSPSSHAVALDYVEVVEQDAAGITLLATFPAATLQIDPADTGTVIRLAGLGNEPRSGQPDVPILVASVGVPEGARVTVDTTVVTEQPLALSAVRRVATDEVRGGGVGRRPPAPRLVEVEQLRFRELRLARITVRPVRHVPATDRWVLSSQVRIRIDFHEGRGFARAQGRMNAMGRAVQAALLNREVVSNPLYSLRESAQARAKGRAPVAANPGVRVPVATSGLQRVTWEALQAAGFNAEPVDPRRLEVSFRGTPVPSRVVGDADGSFDPGDAVEFYGVVTPSRYSTTSVYWLEQKTALGLRFPQVDATPAGAPLAPRFQHTVRYEDENSIYTTGAPAEEGDPRFFWAWFENTAGDPRITSLTVSKTLPGVVSAGDAVLRASFLGRTDPPDDPDHRARFVINGNLAGFSLWNGKAFHLAELPFDAAWLNQGTNTMRLDWRFVAFPDIYYLDWIEIEYPRLTAAVDNRLTVTTAGGAQRYRISDLDGVIDPLVLDVTDPFAAVELHGAVPAGNGPYELEFQSDGAGGDRYLVVGDGGRVQPESIELDTPSFLRTASQGADLLVVAPAGWEDELQPLVDYRRAQGLRVLLANLTDVADEFAGGNADDLAIRDFVQWAYEHYQPPAVSELLLVGEPNVDPLNNLDRSPHHHLMPTHFAVTVEQGETPSDTWFGAVAGDDLLPDVAVARFSVRTPEEAQQLVTKTLAYETAPWDPTWGRTLVHVASNDASFEDAFDNVLPLVPADFTVQEQYRAAGANTTTIRREIDAGALLVSFVGHGNVEIWADSPGGPFWTVLHVMDLVNTGKLPIVVALNCLNGLVADATTTDSMAEVFHNQPDSGAIAMWSPSALGFLRQYDELQQVLYDTLFVDGVSTVGAATTASLVETYLTRPLSIDVVKEMVLLADPTTRIFTECAITDASCDGIDDDCDGSVDEDFVPADTYCGVGACQSTGATRCDPGGLFVDSCTPGAPAADDASCDDVDDDCDGLIDEDFTVTTTFCGLGACANTGQRQCVGAQIEDNCAPFEPAADDATCDGVDDDCDTQVDEDFTPAVTECGLGVCVATGLSSCETGKLLDNCDPGTPGPDDASCNALDDDCDGMTDEEFQPEFVSCGVGACFGTEPMECVDGAIDESCTPGTPAPDDMTCDGIDDNCNGFSDEDYVGVPTTCGIGACERGGETFCLDATVGDNCMPGGPAPADPTCNAIDEDCDGLVDEDFAGGPTTCGVGECGASGTATCTAGDVIDKCTPLEPTVETCDGLDNDCDGSADEDVPDAPTWFFDGDLDGYGDSQATQVSCSPPVGFVAQGGDCADGDAGVWATPGEVRNLRFGDPTSLSWQPPLDPGGENVTTVFLRSAERDDFVDATTCIDGGQGTTAADLATPASRVTWYYLARGQNACPAGLGSLGTTSFRVNRVGRSCP